MLGGLVGAMVPRAATILPAEAEDMIGETELDVVVVAGDGTVGLAGAIPYHNQGESELAKWGESGVKRGVVDAVATPLDRFPW
jgi:hypothetical protein